MGVFEKILVRSGGRTVNLVTGGEVGLCRVEA
jgi:hypothetical protein